jgi:RNA polymerase sigma-70 factor (ECF subfamily)
MSRTRQEIELELLIVRCQIGERSAFVELVDSWNPRLLGFVRGMLSDRSASEDVTQEAWISIFRSLPRLEDATRFPPWAFTITRRAIADRLRGEYRRAPERLGETIDGCSSEGEDQLGEIDDRLLIEEAMDALHPVDREVAWLVHIEDRPIAEVAEITQSPLGTVKSRLHRARKQMRTTLESKGYQP